MKMAQPGRSLNVGCSWPGVFLPGASGRTRRFFTQLLFHNPHSFMEAINSIAFFWVCVPQLFKQVLPYPLVVRFFWVMQFFGSWIFWVLCFQGLRFHGYKSFSSGLLGLGNLRIATKVFGVKVSWSKAFGVQSFKVYGFRSLGFLGSIVFLGLKFLGSKV